jgi:hypothetical protein
MKFSEEINGSRKTPRNRGFLVWWIYFQQIKKKPLYGAFCFLWKGSIMP